MSNIKNAASPKLISVLALLTLATQTAVCQLNSNTASVALRATLTVVADGRSDPQGGFYSPGVWRRGNRIVARSDHHRLGAEWGPHGSHAGWLLFQRDRCPHRRSHHANEYSRVGSIGPGNHRNPNNLHSIYTNRTPGPGRSGVDIVLFAAYQHQSNSEPDR